MDGEKDNDIIRQVEEIAEIGERKSQLRDIAEELNKEATPETGFVTKEMIETTERNIERVAKMVKSPEGKCKVIGVDKFEGEDWVEGEYDTPEEALRVAQEKTNEEKPLASHHSVATVFYAYDSKGHYLGGDTWVNE